MLTLNFWLCYMLIASSTVLVILSIYSFGIRQSKGSITLGFLAVAGAIYSFGYGLELASSSLASMLTFNLVQYIAVPFFGPLWLIFALQLTCRGKPLNRYYALLFIIPIAALILRYTSSLHTLFYIDPYQMFNGVFNVLAFDKGPFYYMGGLYTAVCITVASIQYVIRIKHAGGFQRHQFIYIALAQIIMIITSVLTIFNFTRRYIDLTPFVLPVSIALLLTAMLKYRFLNPSILVRSKVFEWSSSGMIVLDTDLNLMDFNPAAIKYYPDYTPQYLGLNIKYTLDRDGSLSSIIESGREQTSDMICDGKVIYYRTIASKLFDKGNTQIGYMITLIDLTDHMNIMKKLEETASTDSLTGVMTRRMFDECSEAKITSTLRRNSPVSFLILDIDNFKLINDTHGHPAGDELLKDLANICGQNLRESDLLGRMGGDEFVVLLPDTSHNNAKLIAERIRLKASEFTHGFENKSLGMTVSIGVAGIDANKSGTLQTLYKYADQALYQAKNNGRNRVEYQYIPDYPADNAI